jgi:hypothetical protein
MLEVLLAFSMTAKKSLQDPAGLKMWNVQNGEFAKDLLTDLTAIWQVKFDEQRCVAAVKRNQHTYIEVSNLSSQ